MQILIITMFKRLAGRIGGVASSREKTSEEGSQEGLSIGEGTKQV